MLKKIQILTIFPELFKFLDNYSIIGRAISEKKIKIEIINFRDFSTDKHKKVDDSPYGHNPGMLLKCQPIVHCLSKKSKNSFKILLTPKGKTLTQKKSLDIIKKYKSITLICGHYEGFDARIKNYIDYSMSLGNFITSGGESVAITILDVLIRLIPGVIKSRSLKNESFTTDNYIEYDQYTKPANFQNHIVPLILRNGNHKLINKLQEKSAKENKKNKK